jgi:hypothetical protein
MKHRDCAQKGDQQRPQDRSIRLSRTAHDCARMHERCTLQEHRTPVVVPEGTIGLHGIEPIDYPV